MYRDPVPGLHAVPTGSLDDLLVGIRGELLDISNQLVKAKMPAHVAKLLERLQDVSGEPTTHDNGFRGGRTRKEASNVNQQQDNIRRHD